MQTNPDADESMPPANPDQEESPALMDARAEAITEAPPDARAADVVSESAVESTEEADELARLTEAASRARLSVSDEERLVTLLKDSLLGGRAGVTRAVEILPRLPWIVGVRGVEQVWPELTAGFRTQLLSGLAKDDTDAARRIRLSLARALFKLDVPVALKVALNVLKDLRDKETNGLTQKNAQIISNVFIGRGKPWLAQLPLAELKPAEIDLLVQSAVQAVFSIPHPPVAQLGVVKWAQEAGRLDKLPEPALAAITAVISRWNAKWQSALRKEVAELPEALVAAMKPARAEPEAAAHEEMPDRDDREHARTNADAEENEDGDADEEAPKKERPVYEPRPPREPSGESQEREPQRERESSRERPVYTPRNAGSAGGGRTFNLGQALKDIETHVQSLRNELSAAQTKSRQREEVRPRRQEKLGAIIVGEPTPDELARLNLQLEARNAELQARIEDLMQHSEDVAASVGAVSDGPVGDAAAQLRTLLGFKLRDHFADFLALEQESNDRVVRQHYPAIMRQVFEVLREVEIPLGAGEEEKIG